MSTLRIMRVYIHVFSEMEDLNMMPQMRPLDGCTHNLLLVASRHHGQGLLEVPSPSSHSNATKSPNILTFFQRLLSCVSSSDCFVSTLQFRGEFLL